MSTDNTAFTAQVAHSIQDVRFNPVVMEGYNYKISNEDLIHIPITITNNSNSPFVNELVGVAISGQGRVSLAPSLSDLRFYDSDAKTEIPFCVEGSKFTTAFNVIFGLTLAVGATKVFYVGYGSRGNISKSDVQILPEGYRKRKSVHIIGSDVRYPTTKTLVDNEKINMVRNHANKFNSPCTWFNQTSNYTLKINMQARQQSIRRISGWMATGPAHNYSLSRRSDSISIFTVINPNANANATRVFSQQDSSAYIVYPYWNASSNTNSFIISNDGGITGISTGVTANTNQICSAHWQKNTANGMRTYRNNTLIAQRNSANVDLPPLARLGFLSGEAHQQSDSFNGDFYELLVYDEAMLSDADRNAVYEVLNAKYRMYGKQSQLTITLGNNILKTSSTSYARRYVFDNSFLPSRLNAILSLKINTAELVQQQKITNNAESFRVYTRAGTPLDFFIVATNDTHTSVFIRCPVINANEKYEVILTYANAAIGSVQNEANVIPAIVRNDSNFWMRGYRQTSDRSVLIDSSQFGNNATQPITANQAGWFRNFSNMNALAYVKFDSAIPTWYSRAGGLAGFNNNEFSMFVAGFGKVGRNSGQFHPFESLLVFHGGTNDVIFPDAFGRLMHARNNFNPFYTAWPAVDPNQNINQALGATFSNTAPNLVASYRLETTGYAKGQTGNGQGWNSYHNQNMWVGIRHYLAQGANVDVNEIIILNKRVTDTEARLIMDYINDIYHIDQSVVIPYVEYPEEVIVGNMPSIFDSYAQVSSYEYSIGDIESIGEVIAGEATISIQNVMEDNFVGVQDDYNWSSSELTEESKTQMQYERRIDITDAPTIDKVRCGYYNHTGNKANLETNSIPNLASQYRITYDNNDFISFRLYVEDVSLFNLEDSKIRFFNRNKILYSSVKWWQNTNNTSTSVALSDPFGGLKASSINITGNIPANSEFVVFASKFGQHPEPLASYNGIHTASVYVKSNKRIVIAQHGSGYAHYIQSSPSLANNDWQRIQVVTNQASYEYESFIIRSLDPLVSGDAIHIFNPTLTAGDEYSNIAGVCDYEARLSDSVISIVDGMNEVKIKKSSFTGSGSWSEPETMELELVAQPDESTTVHYSYFRVEKNMLELPQTQAGSTVQLARTISTDDWETQYTSQTATGIVKKSFVNTQDEAKIVMGDILSMIDPEMRFSDLPTFTEAIIWDNTARINNDTSYISSAAFIINILNLIYPRNIINTIINYNAELFFVFENITYTAEYPQSRFYAIQPTDKVKELLQKILKGLFACLRYDTYTNQIKIRRIPEYLVKDNEAFPTIEIRNVISYRTITSEESEIFNTIKLESYISTLNNNYTTVADTGYIGGFGEQSYEIPPTGDGSFTLFVPIESLGIELNYTPIMRDLYIAGFNMTVEAGNGASANNTGVNILDARQVEDKIAFSMRNTNSTSRYLFNIAIGGYMQSHIPNSRYSQKYSVSNIFADLNQTYRDNPQQNQVSIEKFGVKEYEVDYRFLQFGTVWYNDSTIGLRSTSLRPQWWFGSDTTYPLLNNLSGHISATILPPEGLRINDRVRIKDENSREVIGILIMMEQSNSDTMSVTIKILEYL